MDPKSKIISCKNCKKEFALKSIIQHALQNPKCKLTFNQDQISDLKAQSKEISDAQHKIKMAERYAKNKAIIAEKLQKEKVQDPGKYEQKKDYWAKTYQKKKFQRAEKLQREKEEEPEKYQQKKDYWTKTYQETKFQRAEKLQKEKKEDPVRYQQKKKYWAEKYQERKLDIAMKYQMNKFEIARKYRKNKALRARNYDKTKRAQKYLREMEMIKKKRAELKKNKESNEGKYFEKELVDPVILEVHNKMVDDHFTIAYGTVIKDWSSHLDQAVETVFESELWLKDLAVTDCEQANASNWKKETHTCEYWTERDGKPCVHHMSESQWAEVIETAMQESFEKEAKRIEDEAAKEMFEMEWAHAMNKYPDHRYGNGTFVRVGERTTNKAFATLFKQKFLSMYSDAYDRALDHFMLSDNSALVWTYEDVDEWYSRSMIPERRMTYDFEEILTKELEAIKGILHDEIVEMVEDEFFDALRKKWYDFKDDVNKNVIL